MIILESSSEKTNIDSITESEHHLKTAYYPSTSDCVTSGICQDALINALLYKVNLRKVSWILQILSPLSKGPPADPDLKTGEAGKN